jgi:hypothetical protein
MQGHRLDGMFPRLLLHRHLGIQLQEGMSLLLTPPLRYMMYRLPLVQEKTDGQEEPVLLPELAIGWILHWKDPQRQVLIEQRRDLQVDPAMRRERVQPGDLTGMQERGSGILEPVMREKEPVQEVAGLMLLGEELDQQEQIKPLKHKQAQVQENRLKYLAVPPPLRKCLIRETRELEQSLHKDSGIRNS